MGIKKILHISIILGSVLAFVPNGHPLAAEKIKIGLPLQSPSALIFVAIEQDYFKDEGLDVEVTRFPNSKSALEKGLLSGSVDIVTTSEVPFVVCCEDHPDIRVIASIARSENEHSIIARKDRGIKSPGDLKGKRISTVEGTSSHIYLSYFLSAQGIPEESVSFVFLTPDRFVQAISSGDIDAFSFREPFISQAGRLLGDNAVVFRDPGLWERTENVVTTRKFLMTRWSAAQLYMKALLKAEKYALGHPEETTRMVCREINGNYADVKNDFENMTLEVTLDQRLIYVMEDVNRWCVRRGYIVDHKMPNYLNFVDDRILKDIRPEAVSIIR